METVPGLLNADSKTAFDFFGSRMNGNISGIANTTAKIRTFDFFGSRMNGNLDANLKQAGQARF